MRRFLGVHDSFEHQRMDTCVSYLLLECPHIDVRRHVADMILTICAGSTETLSGGTTLTYSLSIPVVHKEYIFKMLASKLTTSSNAHTDMYFRLLADLINLARRQNSLNVHLGTEYKLPIVTTYLLDEITTRHNYFFLSPQIPHQPFWLHHSNTTQAHHRYIHHSTLLIRTLHCSAFAYRLSLMCRVFTRKYSHHETMARPGSPFSSTPRESSPCLNS